MRALRSFDIAGGIVVVFGVLTLHFRMDVASKIFSDGFRRETKMAVNVLYREQNLVSLSVKNLIKFRNLLVVKI